MDGISQETEAILDASTEDFEDALERANPVPQNGMYATLLTKLSARKIQPKDKSKESMTVMRLSFKVVDDGDYADYTFGHDFFPMAFPEVVSFASAQAGGNCKASEVKAKLVEAVQGSSMFHTEITRTKSSDGKREFVAIKAHRKLETPA